MPKLTASDAWLAGAAFVYAALWHLASVVLLATGSMPVLAVGIRGPVLLVIYGEQLIFGSRKFSNILGEHEVILWPETLLWFCFFAASFVGLTKLKILETESLSMRAILLVLFHLFLVAGSLPVVRLLWNASN